MNIPKDEAAASEEAFVSTPLVILDDIVDLSLYPPIEHNEFTGVDPTGDVDGLRETAGTWERVKANMQCEAKSLPGNGSRLSGGSQGRLRRATLGG